MMRYGIPIMVAGIALHINRTIRKILCQVLPLYIAESEVGVYSPVINWDCLWFCTGIIL
jgi:uncharacterized membrane protein YvlD (DUF360 family)